MDKLFTVQEIADILQIKKNTVYELIKRGELTASKIGKQFRISQEQLNTYIGKKKETTLSVSNRTASDSSILQYNYLTEASGIILNSGETAIVDILRSYTLEFPSVVPLLHSFANEYNSLYSLYFGKSHFALIQLASLSSQTPDFAMIKNLLPGMELMLQPVCQSQLGLYYSSDKINKFSDIFTSDILFINREKGSLPRILLDTYMKEQHYTPSDLLGYENECLSHLAVANAIESKKALAGIGDKSQLTAFPNINFLPITTGTMYLVMPRNSSFAYYFEKIIQLIQSDTFKHHISNLSNYTVPDNEQLIIL